MQADIPKQYLDLCGTPIACHSFQTFARMPEALELVVVCEPSWRCEPSFCFLFRINSTVANRVVRTAHFVSMIFALGGKSVCLRLQRVVIGCTHTHTHTHFSDPKRNASACKEDRDFYEGLIGLSCANGILLTSSI
jgi:hypothetical protein